MFKTFHIFAVPNLQMEMEALHCFVFISISFSFISHPQPTEEDPKVGDSKQHMKS